MATAEKQGPPCKISVAMAIYGDGGPYLAQQLASLLPQLRQDDELIISVDAPTGELPAALVVAQKNHGAVRYVEGPSKGVIRNFEHALGQCTGDVVFLCDQDDVWYPEKIQVMTEALLKEDALLVLSDARVVDAHGSVIHPSFMEMNRSKPGVWSTVLHNGYIGCCMAVRRQFLDFALPFPRNIPMHDVWMGIVAERRGKVHWLRQPLMDYRRHTEAVTAGKSSLQKKIGWRIGLLWALCFHAKRG